MCILRNIYLVRMLELVAERHLKLSKMNKKSENGRDSTRFKRL